MSKRQLNSEDKEFVNVLRQRQKMDITAQQEKASRQQSFNTITESDIQDESIGTCYRCSKSNKRLNGHCSFCEHVVCQNCTQSCYQCDSIFCVACSVLDYSNNDERSYCLSCYSS
ncbi:unnamed protein product [Cunninghamella blakesleeana]